MSGNALSLATSAVLFATLTAVQYVFARIANSTALAADCVSMGVDVLTFVGNLFAECVPPSLADQKRKIQLAMSGISHCLLLGFTVSFLLEGWEDAHSDDDGDGVNGYIVLGFAIGGLLFDLISLLGACVQVYLDPLTYIAPTQHS